MDILKKIIGMIACLGLIPVCGFAGTGNDVTQHFLNLVNNARQNPVAVLMSYGIDRETAQEGLAGNSWILDLENNIPPLAWNERLAESAAGHAADMDANDFYDYTSFNGGQTAAQRIMATGYTAAKSGEVIGLIDLNWFANPVEAVNVMFEQALRKAVRSGFNSRGNILDPDLTEIGISFRSARIGSYNGYVLVADMAAPEEKRVYLMGHFYTMEQGIPMVKSSEDLQGLLVTVQDLKQETGPEQEDPLLPGTETAEPVEVVYPPSVLGPLGSYQVQLPEYYSLVVTLFDRVIWSSKGIAPSRSEVWPFDLTEPVLEADSELPEAVPDQEAFIETPIEGGDR